MAELRMSEHQKTQPVKPVSWNCAHCITRWHLQRFCSCCVPLSLVPPPCCLFFTQASLCWTICRPGISLSWLSAPHSRCFGSESASSWRFSLSSGLSLSLCVCLFPCSYLCKWCAWALPLVFFDILLVPYSLLYCSFWGFFPIKAANMLLISP